MGERHMQTRRPLGLLLILISLLGFGMMQVFVAKTSAAVPVAEQMFFRNLIGFLAVAPLARLRGVPLLGTRAQQPALFTRSLGGYVGVLCMFYAARHASLTDATIVSRLSLFMITIAASVIFHERLTPGHIAAMAAAFAGSWIAAAPRFDSTALPLLAAFGSAVGTTVAYIMLSYFAGRADGLTVVTHFCAVSTVLSLPLMAGDFAIPRGGDLVCVLMIGVFAVAGQLGVTFAYQMAPAGEISLYDQLSIVVNALLACLFLDQAPLARTYIGGGLVLAAGAFLFWLKRREGQR